MVSLLSIILPSLIPAGIDVVKSVVSWATGIKQDEPKTVADRIALMNAENERLKMLAELDKPTGEISRFVANFRAIHRYLMGDMIILATIVYIILPDANEDIANYLLNLTASVFSFFFGDRVYLAVKKRSPS